MLNYFFIYLVKLYRVCISPFFPASCIYETSCSSFMLAALKKHGFILGCFFGVKRILSCNPFVSINKEDLRV